MNRRIKQGLLLALLCALAMGLLTVGAAAAQEIPVYYNGQQVTFSDAQPRLIQSRTMVPFRAILNALGFSDDNITFEEGVSRITARKGDMTIQFCIGDSAITVTDAQGTRVEQADVAPYLDEQLGRTYVPVRFIAQATGCTVGWDSSCDTVVIADYDSLFADMDEQFRVLNKMMAASITSEDEKYLVSGSCNLSYTPDESILPGGEELSMSAELEGKTAAGTGAITMTYQAELDALAALGGDELTPLEQAALAGVIDSLENGTFEYKYDLQAGTIAIRSSIVELLGLSVDEEAVTGDTWIVCSLDDLSSDSYLGTLALLGGLSGDEMTVSTYLHSMLVPEMVNYKEGYVTVQTLCTLYEAMLGDDAFTHTVDGRYDHYSIRFNKSYMRDVFSQLVGEMNSEDLDALVAMMEGSFELTTLDGSFYSYDITLDLSDPETGGTIHFVASAVQGSRQELVMEWTQDQVGTISCSITLNTRKTTRSPAYQLTAKDEQITYDQLLDAMGK